MTENQALSRLIRDRYPFPISHAYAYLESRVDPQDRYAALLACFEVTLKTITTIALASFVHDTQATPEFGDQHLFRELLETLNRPLSLGHWQDLLWRTLRPYHSQRERLVVPELFDFYYRATESGKLKPQQPYVGIIQRMIQERNEEAHHRNRSQTSTLHRQAELAPLEADMQTLLEGLRFLADYAWLYVENAEHHNGQWHYRANYARGNSYPFQQQTWRTTLGVNSRRCLLVNEARPAVLELDPFAIITAEGRLQQPDIFFFDGVFSSGRANFMSYHIGDYIDPTDEGSPASVASDGIISLLRLLENRLPAPVVDERDDSPEQQLAAVEIYQQAVTWAADHGDRQAITLEALRQILALSREEALKQERELESARGIEIEPEEMEVPFEGEPSWANLAYYVLDNGGQEEMFYKDIAAEAEALKDQHDENWQKGDSANVAGTLSYMMSNDARFYKLRRGYYRLTKNNELLSNPSWANLAHYVLLHNDPQRRGMHLQEITEQAVTLKEKYSDWRSKNTQTPSHTVSATMSMDHRFKSLPERGMWRLVAEDTARAAAQSASQSVSQAAAQSAPPPSPNDATEPVTRAQAYQHVLARLEKLGTLTPLPFGRTYYALADKVHLMFRYSKAHCRNDEIEYFLGVTPQYYERIDELGNGYLVFVLGDADNVLLVPTQIFATWVENTEVSGSGTWPIAFYQSEDGTRLERWVPGAGREDVKSFLNAYADLQQNLAQASLESDATEPKKPVRVRELLDAGLLKPGDIVYTTKAPDQRARVVNAQYVEYQGRRWGYNEWGTHVTGWTAINIYHQVIVARTGQKLDDMRKQLSQHTVKTSQGDYRVPILQAIVDLGGEAPTNQVLARVQEILAGQLNAHDLDTFADGKTIRWRNTAQWARNTLREEGLIRDDTPRGVWGISEAGRKWLKAQTGHA